MNLKYIASELVIIAIVDLILAYFVEGWTESTVLAIILMNAIFVIGVLFIAVSPGGANNNIFAMSTEFIAILFMAIGIVACVMLLLFSAGINIIVLVMVLIIIGEAFFLYSNHHINKKSHRSDSAVYDGMAMFRSIQHNLSIAMDECDDYEIKKKIEKSYDLVCSMTSPSNRDVDSINIEIMNCSNQIVKAVGEKQATEIISLCEMINHAVDKRESLVRR